LWLGIALCFLNPGMGQFYLTGGIRYFIALCVLFVLLKQTVGSEYAWIFSGLASIGIMWWRFTKKVL